MKLKVNTFTVKEVCFGPADSFVQGRLTINKEGLIRQLLKDGNIKSASLDIALPGQRKRIAHILDVIKPIADVEKANCFPGLLGNTSTAGDGEINQLEGLDLMKYSAPGKPSWTCGEKTANTRPFPRERTWC